MPDGVKHGALDGRPGPARPLDETAAQAIVQAAVDEALGPGATGSESDTVRRGRRPHLRGRSGARLRRSIPAAAVVLLAISTGASAAWLYREKIAQRWASPAKKPKRRLPPVHKSEPTKESTQPPEPASRVPDLPVRRTAKKKKKKSTPTPATLLQRANQLRGAGRYRRAERTYLRIVKMAPQSDAAYVACVAAASLRAEQLGAPAGAATLYQKASRIRPRGSLDSEILFGLSEAYRQLGRAAAERKTLEELVARHPRSTYATQARDRLKDIPP